MPASTPGQVHQVSPSKLRHPERQARDKIETTDLLPSISKRGIEIPIIAQPRESDGNAEVFDGNRRLDAAIELGLELDPVNCRVRIRDRRLGRGRAGRTIETPLLLPFYAGQGFHGTGGERYGQTMSRGPPCMPLHHIGQNDDAASRRTLGRRTVRATRSRAGR